MVKNGFAGEEDFVKRGACSVYDARVKTISRQFWRAGPVAIGAGVLAFLWFYGRLANPGPIGFRLDDAWIHLVYARGLVQDHALAYNPGTPSTGCTSPLWALVLAALHACFGGAQSLDPLFSSIFTVGAAFQLATIALAASAARDATGSRAAGATAGGLVAFATPWAAAAFSGMEVTLAGLLMVAGVGGAIRGRWGRAGWAMAAAGLARPESAAATLVALGFAAKRRRKKSERMTARDIVRFVGPSIVVGGALALLYLASSGSPFPATFHAKSSFDPAQLVSRLGRTLTQLLPAIPPWGMGLGWLALLGYLPGAGPRLGWAAMLPLAAGATYLLANLALIDPVDPAAFYHVRYILPAVPSLLIALAIGAHRAGAGLSGRAAPVPLVFLAALAAIECARTAPGESRHLHNDVRNINEVQRALGTWLGENVREGEWIAAADAGAIRYISQRSTIDVLGLNTPEVRGHGASEFARNHPVRAIALLPAWFTPESPHGIRVVHEAATKDYTVTSNPEMALQVVVEADSSRSNDADAQGSAATSAPAPHRVRFRGYRAFEVDLLPPDSSEATPSRVAP